MPFHEQTYTINNRYKATVKTPYDFNEYPVTKIYVGGLSRNCVIVEIYRDSSIAYLSAFGYDKRCQIDEKLEKQSGTKDLLKCALSFVFKLNQNLQAINFKDTSFIVCKNKKRLPLYLYSLIKNSKTWYHLNFGARLQDKKQRLLYKGMLTTLKEKKDSWKAFQKCGIPDELKEIHSKSTSNMACFIGIHEMYSDCSIFTPWLEKWFETIEHYNFYEAEWLLKRKKIESWGEVIFVPTSSYGGSSHAVGYKANCEENIINSWPTV